MSFGKIIGLALVFFAGLPTNSKASGDPEIKVETNAIAIVRDAEGTFECSGDGAPVLVELDQSLSNSDVTAFGLGLTTAPANKGGEVRLRRGLEVSRNRAEGTGVRIQSAWHNTRNTPVDATAMTPQLQVKACMRAGALFLEAFELSVEGDAGLYHVDLDVLSTEPIKTSNRWFQIEHKSSVISVSRWSNIYERHQALRQGNAGLDADRMGFLELSFQDFVDLSAQDGSGTVKASVRLDLVAMVVGGFEN